MSPLDEGFRVRIDKLYALWRKRLTAALAGGIKAGKIRKNIAPRNVAALLVAAQMGVWVRAIIESVHRAHHRKDAAAIAAPFEREAVIFSRSEGGWRIVHEHTSVPFYMDGSLRPAFDLEPKEAI
jgi:hypothetical protein